MEKEQDGLMWFTVSIYCVKTEDWSKAMAERTWWNRSPHLITTRTQRVSLRESYLLLTLRSSLGFWPLGGMLCTPRMDILASDKRLWMPTLTQPERVPVISKHSPSVQSSWHRRLTVTELQQKNSARQEDLSTKRQHAAGKTSPSHLSDKGWTSKIRKEVSSRKTSQF